MPKNLTDCSSGVSVVLVVIDGLSQFIQDSSCGQILHENGIPTLISVAVSNLASPFLSKLF